jgi:hypothetical protein
MAHANKLKVNIDSPAGEPVIEIRMNAKKKQWIPKENREKKRENTNKNKKFTFPQETDDYKEPLNSKGLNDEKSYSPMAGNNEDSSDLPHDSRSETHTEKSNVNPKRRDREKLRKLQDQCPAVLVSKAGRYPILETISYRIPQCRQWTIKKIEKLREFHSPIGNGCLKSSEEMLSDLYLQHKSNEHPLCAAIRAISEAKAITCIQSMIKNSPVKLTEKSRIIDVGGAVYRHSKLGRKSILSLIPLFEDKDLLRHFNVGKLKAEHEHKTFQDYVKLNRPLISMSIHSLYYITPGELMTCLLKQEIKVHFAVIHRFPSHRRGKLMDGEISYSRREGTDKVVVQAAGNSQTYSHSNMDWINAGSYRNQLTINDAVVMSWEKVDRWMDVELYKFIVSPYVTQKLHIPMTDEMSVKIQDLVLETFRPGLVMNQKNYQAYLKKIQQKASEMGLDQQLTVKRFSDYYLSRQSELAEMSLPAERRMAEHNDRLNLQRNDGTFFIRLSAVVTLFIWSLWLVRDYLYLIPDLYNEHMLPIVLLAVLVILAVRPEVVHQFRGAFSLLRLFDYCYTGEEGELAGKEKIFKYRPPDESPCEPALCAYPMFYHPKIVPCMPRRCSHNFKAAVEHRVLNKTPPSDWSSVKLPDDLKTVMGLCSRSLVPLKLEEWLERFPAAKRNKLRNEIEEAMIVNFDDSINDSKIFLKREFYSKDNKAPRPIHSSQAWLNYTVGRWLVPLCVLMAEHMPESVCFPVHGDSIEIGEFFNEYKYYNKYSLDYSKFDSTQCGDALLSILRAFELAGLPRDVIELMELDTVKCVVYGQFSLKYIMKCIRFSGRGETLIGNTILNWIVARHVFGPNCKLLVKGDDAVVFTANPILLDTIDNEYTKLGFIIKAMNTDVLNTEFCSSWFVPVHNSYLLVPKIGRFLAKTLWCKNTNYTDKQIEEQFAGILNGVRESFINFPILKGFYRNPIYLKYAGSKALKHDYNEYARDVVVYDEEQVYDFLLDKYDLYPSEIEEMELELSSAKLPHAYEHEGFTKVIGVDWSTIDNSRYLAEAEKLPDSRNRDEISIIPMTILEEVAFNCSPQLRLVVGIIESLVYNNPLHFVVHALLLLVSRFSPLLALAIHLFLNIKMVCKFSVYRSAAYKLQKFNRKDFKNKMAKKNNKQRKSNKQTRRGRRTTRKQGPSIIQAYASMVADPCNGPMLEGFYSSSEGMLNKLKSVYSNSSTANQGYVLWDANYTSEGGASPSTINAIIQYPASAATNPTNTTASRFGTGDAGQTGATILAGAAAFAASDTVADARCVGACLRVSYTGRMDAASGLIAVIDNLPAEALLGVDGITPASVDELFARSTKVERLGLDTAEVKFRPSTHSEIFRSNSEGCLDVASATVTKVTAEAERSGARWMGFAFKGISGMNDLIFEFHQNIEWRPNLDAGFVDKSPVQSSNPGNAQKVVALLDKHHPDWTHNLRHSISNGATQLAKMAFTGVASRYGEQLMGAAVRRSLPMLSRAAPLLLTL